MAERPQMDLNHWRSVSTRETMAMGTLKMVQSWKRFLKGKEKDEKI